MEQKQVQKQRPVRKHVEPVSTESFDPVIRAARKARERAAAQGR